jgi:hypothetical protein
MSEFAPPSTRHNEPKSATEEWLSGGSRRRDDTDDESDEWHDATESFEESPNETTTYLSPSADQSENDRISETQVRSAP